MTNRFTQTLPMPLKPSRYLWWFIVVLHLSVMSVAILTPAFPWWAGGGMALVVALSGWRALRLHYYRQTAQAVQRLVWLEDGQWQLFLASQSEQGVPVQLQSSSWMWQGAFVLNFKQAGGQFHNVIILPDVLDQATLQSLRMRWSVRESK